MIDRMRTVNPAINAVVVLILSAQAIAEARAADRAGLEGGSQGNLTACLSPLRSISTSKDRPIPDGVVAFRENIASGTDR